MNYSELLQLAKSWGNFISDRIIIWRLHLSVFFAVRIQLIAVVVGICPIRFIVRVILIGPILWCKAVKHRGATKSHARQQS